MKKSEFEHAVRAAGAILGVNEVLVIGSQAVHGSMASLFAEAERSIDVGIASLESLKRWHCHSRVADRLRERLRQTGRETG